MHHRGLLGKLCRAAYETVHEMVFAAAETIGMEGLRTGMVVVAQTAGDLVNLHPHLHGLVPRGGRDQDGAWVSVPHLATRSAERLFRAKVLAFLKAEGLLSEKCGGEMRIISVILDPAGKGRIGPFRSSGCSSRPEPIRKGRMPSPVPVGGAGPEPSPCSTRPPVRGSTPMQNLIRKNKGCLMTNLEPDTLEWFLAGMATPLASACSFSFSLPLQAGHGRADEGSDQLVGDLLPDPVVGGRGVPRRAAGRAGHLALGKAYRLSIEGGGTMSDDELARAGGNDSLVHVDFMVGSAELDVNGVAADGTTTAIMREGEWAF